MVDFPICENNIGVKSVYKTKLNEKDEIEKHKARLVAKGFPQQLVIDCGETFALVARLDIVRLGLAIVEKKNSLCIN